jgi:acyl transferase domain-containing protein
VPSKRKTPLIVGSVKSSIGHLEAAAGLAGVIKTVISLENGRIPAQMHLKTLSPKSDYDGIHVPTKTMMWAVGQCGRRRAAINCFGAGGSNGHCVLESFFQKKREIEQSIERPYLYMVSASTPSTLKAAAANLMEYVKTHKPCLEDLAYTLLERRSRLSHTQVFTASTLVQFVQKAGDGEACSANIKATDVNNMCYIFTGQGAQWPGMGKQLLQHSSIFRKTIERCEMQRCSCWRDMRTTYNSPQ